MADFTKNPVNHDWPTKGFTCPWCEETAMPHPDPRLGHYRLTIDLGCNTCGWTGKVVFRLTDGEVTGAHSDPQLKAPKGRFNCADDLPGSY